jgi:hypothetical protein
MLAWAALLPRRYVYGALAVWAIAVRVVVALLAPAAFYFPDSWKYVTDSTQRSWLSAIEPPTISWFWQFGTVGQYTERNVLLLQGALGVLGVLLLCSTLASVTRLRWALALSVLYSVIPQELFVERAIMTYAVVSFLTCLILRLTVTLSTTTSVRRSSACLVLAFGATGLAGAIRPAFLLAALLVLPTLLVVWLRSPSMRSHRSWVAVWAIPLALVAAVSCPVWLADAYHGYFGAYSLSPAEGTVLFTRSSPLVGCGVPPGSTPITADSIHEVCGSYFAGPPGIDINLMWASTPLHTSQHLEPQFALTQEQMLHLALDGMARHPLAAAGQVLDELWWEFARTPVSDLDEYTNGASRFGPPISTTFHGERAWFSGASGRSLTESLPLKSVVGDVLWLPQLVLWVTIALGLSGLVRRRRRTEQSVASRHAPATWWARVASIDVTARRSVGVVSTLVLATSMLSVSLGAPPVWSYAVPLLAPTLVLLGLTLPTTTTRARPA